LSICFIIHAGLSKALSDAPAVLQVVALHGQLQDHTDGQNQQHPYDETVFNMYE
jgi:hypothetical protein